MHDANRRLGREQMLATRLMVVQTIGLFNLFRRALIFIKLSFSNM